MGQATGLRSPQGQAKRNVARASRRGPAAQASRRTLASRRAEGRPRTQSIDLDERPLAGSYAPAELPQLAVAATDFFTTEVWTAAVLKTYYVLFVIELDSRRVHLAGLTRSPDDLFMGRAAERAARRLGGRRFLICDRDTKFWFRFRAVMEADGIRLIKAPYQASNANAHT